MATTHEIKLKRFLNYGQETAFYEPSNRFQSKYYAPDSLSSVEALLADGKLTDATTHILKAFSDGYSAHPESLVFALAVCARQKTSVQLREAAYNAFKTICKTPYNLFLFLKFASELAAPNSCWGRGCRRVVKEWYLRQEPMELAESVTRVRSRFNWSHRDVLKLAHPKTDDIAKTAVFKYVIRGLPEAKKVFGNKAEAQQVLNYLQAVEDLKHFSETEVEQAARHLEQHKLSLDHVPAHLLKSKEMWSVVVPRLPLSEVLCNLKRLSRMGMLRGSNPVVAKVLDVLGDQAAVAECGLYPARVLISLRSYEQSAKVHYTDPNRDVRPPPQPNPKVIEALNQLLESTFKLLVPTGMRYLVAVDTRERMTQSHCHLCGPVTSLEAATLLALCLVKTERDVTVVAFGVGTPKPVDITKEMTLQQALSKIKEVPTTSVDIAEPVLWAKNTKKNVDVFVMLTDYQLKPGEVKACDAIAQYRKALELPNAKYILCAFTANAFSVAAPDDPGMLDMCGFDGKVSRVIEAFSRGAF